MYYYQGGVRFHVFTRYSTVANKHLKHTFPLLASPPLYLLYLVSAICEHRKLRFNENRRTEVEYTNVTSRTDLSRSGLSFVIAKCAYEQ